MNKYFQKKYAMSEKGAKNLTKAIFSRTIVNLTKLFSPAIGFTFIYQFYGNLEGVNKFNFNLLDYVLIILLMLVFMFYTAGWDYVRLYNNVYLESANIRIDVANRLKKLPLAYFNKKDLTDIATTMMEDITLYEQIFSHAVPQLYATYISTLIIGIMMFIYDWRLALATFWVIPIGLLISLLSKKIQKKYTDKFVNTSRIIYDDMQENIDQIKEIKAYNLEHNVVSKFNLKLRALSKSKKKLEFIIGTINGISNVILRLGLISVAIIGASLYAKGKVSSIVYISFLMLSVSIYLPIDGIITFISMHVMLDSVVARIKEIKTMPIQEGSTNVVVKNFDIEFKDVYFGYDEYSVINGVSFVAKQGEVVALIGQSGSGKSTLAKLAARFWDVSKGKILLGGNDISKIAPECLLKYFSIVFQDVILFNASIKDNVKIGKNNATDEEVLKALEIARCMDFIKKLPNGVNTIIGENGQRLSGGERQRLSIARAILKDAPIILLDEATASLDCENESLIQEALTELIKDKTVICIAHRLRTIRSANNIILLKNGSIQASGTDKELYRTSLDYKKMVDNNSQAS